MSKPFPHGLTWADIFCRGSTARDFNWGHMPDESGKCRRCTYTRPAEVTRRLEAAGSPTVISISKSERRTLMREKPSKLKKEEG